MRRFVGLWVALFLLSSIVQAQEPTAPIIALAKNDFYAINPDDGSFTQITHHQEDLYFDQPSFQRDLAISPDGQYLAYLKTPRFFAIAMKNGLLGNFGFGPSDVVLLNLATGEEKVIAQQQANVKWSDSVRLWYRWKLNWSPDGSQLAYYQYRGFTGEPSFQAQIMIYDRVTDKTVTLVQSEDYLDETAWLAEGISVGPVVYNTNGDVIVQHSLTDRMIFGHPLMYQGREYAIIDRADVIPHDGRVYLMDLMTGEYKVVEGYESSVSATAQDDSLVFIKDDNDTRPWYVINPKTGAIFTPPKQAPYAVDFTFSPDGKQFAYVLIGTSVNITDLKGKQLVVELAARTIIWGSKRYTIASKSGDQSAPVMSTDVFNITTSSAECGTLPPVGLVSGGQGRVMVGSGPNRIRSEANAGAAVIGKIPEGAIFTVINGQGVCSDNIRWVQVESQGVIGWTAEGADGQVFLEGVQ
jgi:Tol biopolymer transport system component